MDKLKGRRMLIRLLKGPKSPRELGAKNVSAALSYWKKKGYVSYSGYPGLHTGQYRLTEKGIAFATSESYRLKTLNQSPEQEEKVPVIPREPIPLTPKAPPQEQRAAIDWEAEARYWREKFVEVTMNLSRRD